MHEMRVKRLLVLKYFILATENFISLKLHEKLNKSKFTYQDAEKLVPLCNFITNKQVEPSELLIKEDDVNDILIDTFIELKNNYKELKWLGFNKKESEKIIRKLKKKTLIKLPNYSISLVSIINHILLYINNIITLAELKDNFYILGFTKKEDLSLFRFRQLINQIEKIIYQ